MNLLTTLSDATPTIFIRYTHDGVEELVSQKLTNPCISDHLTVEKRVSNVGDNNFELNLTLTANDQNIRLQQLEFLYEADMSTETMLAEGFQSWSQAREVDRYSSMPGIQRVVAWVTQFDLQGDYLFYNYSGKQGNVHSTGYTYFRNPSNRLLFLGSVSEDSGYTYFKTDYTNNQFSIYKDVLGKVLPGGEKLNVKLFVTQRDYKDLKSVWDDYASYYPRHIDGSSRHLTGWTSWYNTYEHVTEKDVLENLEAFKTHNYPIDVFQIDDGFETAVGDWLDVAEKKFPRGMQPLATEIKEAGYLPGIWLAPFAVGFKSKIVNEHPEWLLTNTDGSLLVAGPNWGGFYALDIYNPEVREYLQRVFDTVIDEWGYKLLKLDFLFASAMIPMQGKPRGEIMWEAVTMIEELTRKRAIILGSGVPLPATWGRFDYCRVSSDTSPWWDHSVLRVANVRERVATANALVSTLHRWPMISMFGSDPDVFFIRSENSKLTKDERYTLCVLNVILGQVTLMSDNVAKYNAREHKLYASTFPKAEVEVQQVLQIAPDVYQVNYICNQHNYKTWSNLSPAPYNIRLPNNNGHHYFEKANVLNNDHVEWHSPSASVSLKAHETRTFLEITNQFAGSTAHLVPGWEVKAWEGKGDHIDVTLKPTTKLMSATYYIQIEPGQATLPIVYANGKKMDLERVDHPLLSLVQFVA
ncbi:hypothetical protein DFQ28_000044 [Apophysomyces sp. BC1034]|nr:hypothetical protein DFQ30_007800 [Apophysomyces sp. BC1015]KAG0182846.1 hypothetical protein DFQ29_001786 [Apophysomyces sp. BC1021]KAG0194945.1 hypothetical protein DFQ28_000044 [Apophysomyces sp. BC1034]